MWHAATPPCRLPPALVPPNKIYLDQTGPNPTRWPRSSPTIHGPLQFHERVGSEIVISTALSVQKTGAAYDHCTLQRTIRPAPCCNPSEERPLVRKLPPPGPASASNMQWRPAGVTRIFLEPSTLTTRLILGELGVHSPDLSSLK